MVTDKGLKYFRNIFNKVLALRFLLVIIGFTGFLGQPSPGSNIYTCQMSLAHPSPGGSENQVDQKVIEQIVGELKLLEAHPEPPSGLGDKEASAREHSEGPWHSLVVTALLAEKKIELEKKYGREKASAILKAVQSAVIELEKDELIKSKTAKGPELSSPQASFVRHLQPKLIYTINGDDTASFSHNGIRIVVGSKLGVPRIKDLKNKSLIVELKGGHSDWCRVAAFAPDDRSVLTGDDEGIVKIWSLPSGRLIATLIGHRTGIIAGQFSPKTNFIATISEDGRAKLWKANDGSYVRDLDHQYKEARSLSFSRDGELIATGSKDGVIRIFETMSGKVLKLYKAHTAQINSVEFSSDGKWILSASAEGKAKIIEASSGVEKLIIDAQKDNLTEARFGSAESGILITASKNQNLKFWDSSSGHLIQELKTGSPVLNFALSSNLEQLLITLQSGKIQFYHLFEKEPFEKSRGAL